MRCLALAAGFTREGWSVGFAATEETFSAVAALSVAPVEKLALPAEVEGEPEALARRWPQGADILVVDHYERDVSFEYACRPWAKRIVVIDDLANRQHDAELLVDAAARSTATYRDLVGPICKVLVGSEYAIVDPKFCIARDRALRRRNGRPVGRVLVSFGQIDAANATERAIAALKALGFGGCVDIVLGGAAPHLSAIEAQITERMRLHVDTTSMAVLMTEADLAIGAGGVTAWERCCVGLPSAIATVAGNQIGLVESIVGKGAGIAIGQFDPNFQVRLSNALNRLLSDGKLRAAIAKSAALLVDGQGLARIVGVLTRTNGELSNPEPLSGSRAIDRISVGNGDSA